jgi:hypothetical protein
MKLSCQLEPTYLIRTLEKPEPHVRSEIIEEKPEVGTSNFGLGLLMTFPVSCMH